MLKKSKIKLSTEKQSYAIIVHKAKRTATSTRTHTRVKRCRAGLVPKITTKMCKALSSHQIEAVFARIREQHTRQNKPYRLGVVPAGVAGARGRCCPAATVPVAVVFACGVCCCIAEEIQNKTIDRKAELCHHRPQSKAHSNELENTHKSFKMGFWVCGSGGVRDVHVLICARVVQIGVAELLLFRYWLLSYYCS